MRSQPFKLSDKVFIEITITIMFKTYHDSKGLMSNIVRLNKNGFIRLFSFLNNCSFKKLN